MSITEIDLIIGILTVRESIKDAISHLKSLSKRIMSSLFIYVYLKSKYQIKRNLQKSNCIKNE